MRMVLHILKKDVRHFWPEITAAAAVVAVYMGYQPRLWAAKPIGTGLLGRAAGALPVLLILMWAFLIVRVVQDEALVGDRHFWMTRPYQWQQLLAAKLLFIVLFVHVPLFLAQLILLGVARFPVWSSAPGLLAGHLGVAIAICLPALTIASITRSVGQATLVLVAVCAVLIAVLWGADSLFAMQMSVEWSDNLQEAIYLLAVAGVTLVQFALRRTKWSWYIVLGAAAGIFLLVFLTPYDQTVPRIFPLPTAQHPAPVEFTRDPELTFQHNGQPEEFGDTRSVQIPLDLASFAENTAIEVRGTRLEMDFDDGGEWSSGWKASYNSLLADRTRFWPDLEINKAEFARIHNRRGKARLSLAINVFRNGPGAEVRLAGDKLALPGGTRCTQQGWANALRCFAALHQPEPLILTAPLPNPGCRVKPQRDFQGWAESTAAYIRLAGSSYDPFFSPVETFSVSLQRFYSFEDLAAPLPICEGTVITWKVPKFVYSTRVEIDLGELTLDDYHPSYPRQIVPQEPRPPSGPAAGTLSQNRLAPWRGKNPPGV